MTNINPPVIGILRGVEANFFKDLMEASFSAGLRTIEVTMNTRGAENIVTKNCPKVPTGCLLGMGTIRNLEEAKRARNAGAMFLVTPNTDTAVIRYAKKENIPIIAGALTPSEAYTAWQEGADMVKVFPCGSLGGPRYIKELLGPFDMIPLVAVGGVTPGNVNDYFAAGAVAVGVGSSLFGKNALEEKNLQLLTKNVKNFIELCSSVRK